MRHSLKRILGVCLSMVLLHSTQAAGVSNETDSAILQAKLTAIHSLSASFTQEIKAKKRHIATTTGRMALSRPGLLRWQTDQPTSQLVVADGKHIWVYDKDLEQVSVRKQTKTMGGVAALFLSEDPAVLKQDFQVSQQTGKTGEDFLLIARSPKASFEKIQLIFEAQQLRQIILYDQLGQRTQIKLSAVKTNAKLSTKLFHFSVPKGVDVVQQ